MCVEPNEEIQEKEASAGSASERSFKLLLTSIDSLDGLIPESKDNLRKLFDEDRELSGEEILKAVFETDEKAEKKNAED